VHINSLDWSTGFPGNHDWFRTSNKLGEGVLIAKPQKNPFEGISSRTTLSFATPLRDRPHSGQNALREVIEIPDGISYDGFSDDSRNLIITASRTRQKTIPSSKAQDSNDYMTGGLGKGDVPIVKRATRTKNATCETDNESMSPDPPSKRARYRNSTNASPLLPQGF
jgi:hypothetical protein